MTRHPYITHNQRPSVLNILFHTILVFLTGGLWLIWLVVRFLRNNS